MAKARSSLAVGAFGPGAANPDTLVEKVRLHP